MLSIALEGPTTLRKGVENEASNFNIGGIAA